MTSMFANCYSLQTVPLFNTATNTGMGSMFQNCYSLQTVPLFNTAAVTVMNSMFSGCTSLQTVPLFNTAAVTAMTSMFQNCYNLQNIPALNCAPVNSSANLAQTFLNCNNLAQINATGFLYSFSITACKLSATALNTLFANLGRVTTTQTLTLGTNTNWGAITYTLTGTTTSGSTTVTMASTANLAVGMEIAATGISSAVAVTMQDAGDTVTRTAHGIPNGTIVSFATIVSTTGIATYTPYYVVNATADTFQVSLTSGGAAIALTTNGSGTLLYGTTITAINPNVSITLSIPASASGSVSTVSGTALRSLARVRGWTVSG